MAPTPNPCSSLTAARWPAVLLALAVLLLAGCLHYREPAPGELPLAYLPAGPDPELAARFAPAFLVQVPDSSTTASGPVRGRL